MQKIMLIGNLGRDPEVRYMPNGDPVVTFALATNRKLTETQKSQTGMDKETTWFRVTCYGKTAKYLAEYGQKGAQAYVEGRLSCDPATGCPKIFTRKDGNLGASYDVSAETVQVLTGYKTAPTSAAVQQPVQAQAQPQQKPLANDYDFEIPY